MTGHRREKVASLLKRELSKLLVENLAERYGLVTLTDIELTSDFKEAKVFILVHEQKYEREILDILESYVLEFQRILRRKLRMKFTPRLKFVIDKHLDKLERIDKLIKEIEHEY